MALCYWLTNKRYDRA